METETKHWTSKVKTIQGLTLDELGNKLNEFYENKFIIATQVFPSERKDYIHWYAIIYYKISPEEQEHEK